LFDGSSVLVTGGTGSFGKAFIRRILDSYKPRRVVIYSRDELKQSEMERDFDCPLLRFFIGDVRDLDRLRLAMRDVDYVVHAAALKQVPAAEYNPMECIKTNIVGAWNVVQAAIDLEVEKVVALSTDKAANPINLYGATKLCSDKIFVSANNIAGTHRTRFSVVRYGNVVGSRGSVVPVFKSMIEKGAKFLPITDARMTRFWITLEQGVDFVLKAFARMRQGEIFVPKIPSARIVDLATAMAPQLPQRVVGIRPGEKLHEVLCPKDEAFNTLEFHDHSVVKPAITFQEGVDYSINPLGETGKPVEDGFEYQSGSNPWFLSVEDIRTLVGGPFGR
jgi:UDP-N-acetylglucosamine 4,6-dehydratase